MTKTTIGYVLEYRDTPGFYKTNSKYKLAGKLGDQAGLHTSERVLVFKELPTAPAVLKKTKSKMKEFIIRKVEKRGATLTLC